MDYLLHKANGTDTAELNKQVGGFSAISSVLVKLNHNKVGEMELKLSAPAYTIAIGDWVEAKGKRFYCLNNWKEYIPGEFSVTLLTVEGFALTSNLYHCTESFDTVYSWSRDNNKVDTGSLKTFGEFFCYNVNYQQNTRLFKLGSFPEGMDEDYRVLSFTNENALSCLYEICTAYGVRYEFVLNEDEDSLYILNFYNEDVVYPETFSYEKQGGLYELNISNADGQVYTEFVVLGSEDNLPADYPHTELHLPDDYPLSMVKYPDKYATWGRSVKELKLDVKPSRVGSVTAEVSGDLNSFIDSDLIGATWTPVGGVIHIVEGPLLGFEFNVSDFNATTGKVTIEQNTEGATTLPEAEYYKFTVGTKYTITGIPLPESYLTTAEENLLSESEPHRLYWSDSRYDARIRVKPKFLETNGEIEAGMLLPVVHEAINLNRNFRVQSITYDPRMEQYYDVTEITISDFRQESIADSQHKAIRTALHRLDNADKVSTSIKTSIKNLDTYIDGAFADGLVSEAEAKAIEKYINTVNSTKADIDAQFTALYANSYLSGDPKTNLNSAKTALNTAITNLLSSINTAIADGSATAAEKADVDSKFTAFNSALSTYQTRVEQAQGAIHAAAAKAYTDGQLSDYAEVVTGLLGDLQNQIDGNITTWFYAYVPTTANAPASDWTTTALKNQHLGDLFYDTETGYCYRFQLSGETYSWVKITDTDVTRALADAAAAQDTADNKRRVFVATPTTPYEVGDLWTGGPIGDLKKCKVERLTGAYNAADWELATKYTDNTAVNQLESDLEYLTEGFKDGSTYVTGGLVLSEFVGVTDGATPTPNVVAGMAGKDFVLDGETPITSPMFFAGSTTAQNANNAKFRVYRDGSMYAELGKIGGLTIAASKLYLGTGNHNNADTAFYVDDDGKFSLKNKLSFDGTNLTINGGGTFTGSVSIGDILIGKDAYGSGLHGIKLNANNYWYLDGANAKFKIGGTTNNLSWNGSVLEQNGVKIGGGSMVGTSIDIPNATTPLFKVTAAGVITAKSGTIGGVNFTDTKLYLGTGTYGNSNTGFYVDTSAKFSLKDKLKFDGTNLTINGGGTFSGALSAATGSFAGSLSAATGTFSGSLSAASGTFEGLLDVGGIKIGLNAISAGIDGLYINANNYWDESGNFKAGGSASYVYWNGTTFAIKGDITGSTGTFGGVFAGTIEVGSTLKMGADAGGTGDFGIYIDSANYWLESGFSVGVGGSLLKINDGALEFSGELSSASGTFTGRIEVGDYLKIGANVSGANDGIFINTNNYWYDNGTFKVGGEGDYMSFDGTNATFKGALSAATGSFSGTITSSSFTTAVDADGTSVSVSSSAASSKAGILLNGPSSHAASIGFSSLGGAYLRVTDGTRTNEFSSAGLVVDGGDNYVWISVTSSGSFLKVSEIGGNAVLEYDKLNLDGLIFNTTNLGTGSVGKSACGFLRAASSSKQNEDSTHTHSKISGYTVVVGTGSDPDTIYLSTS